MLGRYFQIKVDSGLESQIREKGEQFYYCVYIYVCMRFFIKPAGLADRLSPQVKNTYEKSKRLNTLYTKTNGDKIYKAKCKKLSTLSKLWMIKHLDNYSSIL